MQRRKHQQLLGRWLNFTKPDEVILLSDSALEAPTQTTSVVGNERRRGRLNSANSNREVECLEASFSLNEDTSEAWEHPLASNASVSSFHDANSVCLSTSSSARLTKSSSMSPSRRGTTSPVKSSHSPIKGNPQDRLFSRSSRHYSASSTEAQYTRDRKDSTSKTDTHAKRPAEKYSKNPPRPELEPLSIASPERSPSVLPAVSPLESLSFMMREIDLNESILKDDGSTNVPSPIVPARDRAQAGRFFSNSGSGAVDDEFQMSFAVHELLSDDGPDIEVFTKAENTKGTRRGLTGPALEQSFESSGGGIDEFVAINSQQHHKMTKDSHVGRHRASRTDHRCSEQDDLRAIHSLDQRRANAGKTAIPTLLRSPGGTTTALEKTTSWNDTLDDGIKFRRVANGNSHFYDGFPPMYAQDETAVHALHTYENDQKSMNFDELHGDGRFVDRHIRPDLSTRVSDRVSGRGSPPLGDRDTFDEEEEQENELIRFAIEQSLSESGAVSYQNDFHDASSVSTSHNIASKQSERSCSESFSHHASFSTRRRGIIGPEDVSISEDQEREMIELALERSLQDSRASQSHTSISSRGGGSISTTQTLESIENHFYPGARSGSSHSRTSLSGVSSHSRSSLSASPKSHSFVPEAFVSPRQVAGNAPHESALLLMLDDDDYDEDELLAPAGLSPSHGTIDRRNGWSESCSARPPPQQQSASSSSCYPFSPLQNPSSVFVQPSCSSSCSLDGRMRSSSSSYDGRDRPRYRWELELASSNQRAASPFEAFDPDDEVYDDRSGGRSHAMYFSQGDALCHPDHEAAQSVHHSSAGSWNRGRSQSYHRDSRIAASFSSEQSHGGHFQKGVLDETDDERAARMERELVELAMQRSISEL
jgi:hypothetical protein